MMKQEVVWTWVAEAESRGIVIIGVADIRRDPDKWWNELRSRMP